MILWRVSNYQTLDGVGACMCPGVGIQRASLSSIAPSTLPRLCLKRSSISRSTLKIAPSISRLRIEGPDSLSIEKVDGNSLPPNWAEDISISQHVGDRWLSERHSLLLQVPSVLVPETWNVLVNPQHPKPAC